MKRIVVERIVVEPGQVPTHDHDGTPFNEQAQQAMAEGIALEAFLQQRKMHPETALRILAYHLGSLIGNIVRIKGMDPNELLADAQELIYYGADLELPEGFYVDDPDANAQ